MVNVFKELLLENISFSGGINGTSNNNILEFNQIDEEWQKIGSMMEKRVNHGVSVVKYEDFSEWCI